MMGKGCDGFCYLSKIFDELMVVTDKTKECSYVSAFLGFISLIAAVLDGSKY